MLSYALSFSAGALTAISPCVLPALPFIVGSAAQEHRHAPLSVAAGMILSFTALGLFFSTVGTSLSIDPSVIRSVAALLIAISGLILLVPYLQRVAQQALEPIAQIANIKLSRGRFQGLSGQFVLGGLLGAAWSPCVGPTFGAAIGLASQSGGFVSAGLMMLLFGVGSTTPLLIIAYGSRKLFNSQRRRITRLGQLSKPMFGIVSLGMGVMILSGLDKSMEAVLLNRLPKVWIDLITSF